MIIYYTIIQIDLGSVEYIVKQRDTVHAPSSTQTKKCQILRILAFRLTLVILSRERKGWYDAIFIFRNNSSPSVFKPATHHHDKSWTIAVKNTGTFRIYLINTLLNIILLKTKLWT